MAHEINANDKVVLNRQTAWHGLGLVINEDWTPHQAAEYIMPNGVRQLPMTIMFNGERKVVDGHMLNVRADDGTQLGVVSESYKVIQPHDMADFAEAIVAAGQQVKIETAGTIRSGKRIWFLMKGEEFQVAKGDSVYPYILLSNGYDGLATFRLTPTTVRVVCSNTMHMVIPRTDTGELGTSALSIRHTVNAMDRVEEAKEALKNYGKSLQATKEVFDSLAAKPVTSEEVQKFFLESYTADFGNIPDNPKDGFEERKRERATSAWNSFSKRFDDERAIAGASAWNMVNAYSGLIQHDQKARGKDDVRRIEQRVESNLFGLNSVRTFNAAQKAFQMVAAV